MSFSRAPTTFLRREGGGGGAGPGAGLEAFIEAVRVGTGGPGGGTAVGGVEAGA